MSKRLNSPEDIERIKKYLNKQMSPEEAKKFEAEMKNNSALAKEVEVQKFERAFNYLSIRAELREIRQELSVEEEKTSPMWIVWLRNPYLRTLAATIIIALTGISVWQLTHETRAVTAHKSDTLKVSPGLSEKINEIARLSKQPRIQTPKVLDNAILAYERADDTLALEKAVSLFDLPKTTRPKGIDSTLFGANPNAGTSKTDPQTNDYRLFYQGLIFLNTGKYDAAISRFGQIKGALSEDAKLYEALAYLKKNDKQTGRRLLDEFIAKSSNEALLNQAKELKELLEAQQ